MEGPTTCFLFPFPRLGVAFQCLYWASFRDRHLCANWNRSTGPHCPTPNTLQSLLPTNWTLYKKTLTAAARERDGVRELLLLLPQLLLLLCCFRYRAAQKLRHSSTSHYCECYYYCYCYCIFRSWFQQHPVELLRWLVTPAPVCSSGGNKRTLCSHFTC